jgi:hypothetical protein
MNTETEMSDGRGMKALKLTNATNLVTVVVEAPSI